MTNLLLQFLTTPRADAKRFEMLSLIASVLHWSDEERETGGLQKRDGSGGASGQRTPGSGRKIGTGVESTGQGAGAGKGHGRSRAVDGSTPGGEEVRCELRTFERVKADYRLLSNNHSPFRTSSSNSSSQKQKKPNSNSHKYHNPQEARQAHHHYLQQRAQHHQDRHYHHLSAAHRQEARRGLRLTLMRLLNYGEVRRRTTTRTMVM